VKQATKVIVRGCGRDDAAGLSAFLRPRRNGKAVGVRAEFGSTLGADKSRRIVLLIAVQIGDVVTTRRRH
jgi:hypothetical protein